MFKIFLVGVGGCIGAISRYVLAGLLYQFSDAPSFPFATLVINVIGCFCIGAFYGLADARSMFTPEVRAFAVVGVLGGFTTYSAFGYETFALARDGQITGVLVNVGLHLVLGLGAVWCGYFVMNNFFKT